jgi:hypothetical protein
VDERVSEDEREWRCDRCGGGDPDWLLPGPDGREEEVCSDCMTYMERAATRQAHIRHYHGGPWDGASEVQVRGPTFGGGLVESMDLDVSDGKRGRYVIDGWYIGDLASHAVYHFHPLEDYELSIEQVREATRACERDVQQALATDWDAAFEAEVEQERRNAVDPLEVVVFPPGVVE